MVNETTNVRHTAKGCKGHYRANYAAQQHGQHIFLHYFRSHFYLVTNRKASNTKLIYFN